MRSVLIFLFIFGSIGNVQAKPKVKYIKNIEQLMAATPDQLEEYIVVNDDALEVRAKISTERVFRPSDTVIPTDEFMRAYIDKLTGDVTYQVFQYVVYFGDWRNYSTVNYETPNGPVSIPIKQISKDVENCRIAQYGLGCKVSEQVAFDVPEEILREYASNYQPSNTNVWKYRLKGTIPIDHDGSFALQEIAAFMKVVDGHREKLRSLRQAN